MNRRSSKIPTRDCDVLFGADGGGEPAGSIRRTVRPSAKVRATASTSTAQIVLAVHEFAWKCRTSSCGRTGSAHFPAPDSARAPAGSRLSRATTSRSKSARMRSCCSVSTRDDVLRRPSALWFQRSPPVHERHRRAPRNRRVDQDSTNPRRVGDFAVRADRGNNRPSHASIPRSFEGNTDR